MCICWVGWVVCLLVYSECMNSLYLYIRCVCVTMCLSVCGSHVSSEIKDTAFPEHPDRTANTCNTTLCEVCFRSLLEHICVFFWSLWCLSCASVWVSVCWSCLSGSHNGKSHGFYIQYICTYSTYIQYIQYSTYVHTYVHTVHTYSTYVHTYVHTVHTYSTYVHTYSTYVHTYIQYIHTVHMYIHMCTYVCVLFIHIVVFLSANVCEREALVHGATETDS